MKRQRGFIIVVICTIGLLLTLIVVKGITHNHFRNNAEKWSEKSFDRSNLIDLKGLQTFKADILLINLNSKEQIQSKNITATLDIEPDQILENSNFRTIHDHKGIIVLASDDQAVSARIWMLLSQMGIKQLYIFIPD